MADDRIKLGLDLGDTAQDAKRLADSLVSVQKAAESVGDTYEVLAGSYGRFTIPIFEQEKAVQKSAGTTKIAADAADDASKKMHGFGSAVLSTSYAVQDFTSQLGTRGLSGAFSAIQNNIPVIVNQMASGGAMTASGAATLAGAIGIVTVGAGLLIENWDTLTKKFGETSVPLPKLRDDLDGVGKALSSITKQIGELEEKSLTDALSHPELKRLGELKDLQSQAASQAADQGIVEGIKATVPDRLKAVSDQVKKALGDAGGGESVADTIARNLGLPYKEALAKVADAVRGDKAAVDEIAKNSPEFGKAFQAIEDELDRAADEFFNKQRQTQEARLKDYLDGVDKVLADQIENIGKTLENGLRSIADRMRDQLEKDLEADDQNARDHPGQDIIRDVENQDFGRRTVDRFGREKDVAGLGLSKKQVEDAADAARDFQRNLGVDDRTAAQFAIQEQIVRNQQEAADKQQQMWARAQMIQQQAAVVPNLLNNGNW